MGEQKGSSAGRQGSCQIIEKIHIEPSVFSVAGNPQAEGHVADHFIIALFKGSHRIFDEEMRSRPGQPLIRPGGLQGGMGNIRPG